MTSIGGPFRTDSRSCPRCKVTTLSARPLERCERCTGCWVANEILLERVAAMQGARPAIEVTQRFGEPVPCVCCAAPMRMLGFFGVPVDACDAHGVWFDAEELQVVLLRSSKVPVGRGDGLPEPAVGVADASSAVAQGGTVAVFAGLFDLVASFFSSIDV